MDRPDDQENLAAPLVEEEHACWVIFLISGAQLHPDLISRILNITPDRSKLPTQDFAGERQLNSTKRANEKLEAHIDELLGILLPVRKLLRDIRTDADLEFYCHITKKSTGSRFFEIPPQMLLMIGHLGARLYFEIADRH